MIAPFRTEEIPGFVKS
jgi:hypothetical protein